MSNILRQQLLENWTYPSLPQSVPGINEFSGAGLYAGRIKNFEGQLSLGWGGKTQNFNLPLVFEPSSYGEVLAAGDLVLAEITSGRVIKKLSLLAPAREKFSETLFGYDPSSRWPEFVALVRQFFVTRNFAEILTPTLVACPGTEPYLKPFSVLVNGEKRFLPTSPEINLKKSLGAGHARVFEVKECFRNGEFTDHHRPEFLMLEWYRSFSNLESILADLRDLMAFLSSRIGKSFGEIQVVTVRELFKKYLDFDLQADTSAAELGVLCERLNINFSSDDSWDEIFFRLFVDKIEASLGDGPLVVRDYPPKLAAYSRIIIGGQSAGWADRFEFYWKGLEIANAFHELNDPRIQRRRMEDDNKRKTELGLEPVPLDEEFLSCLAAGLPPSGGIALGVERIFMAFYDLKNISQVR